MANVQCGGHDCFLSDPSEGDISHLERTDHIQCIGAPCVGVKLVGKVNVMKHFYSTYFFCIFN